MKTKRYRRIKDDIHPMLPTFVYGSTTVAVVSCLLIVITVLR